MIQTSEDFSQRVSHRRKTEQFELSVLPLRLPCIPSIETSSLDNVGAVASGRGPEGRKIGSWKDPLCLPQRAGEARRAATLRGAVLKWGSKVIVFLMKPAASWTTLYLGSRYSPG